MSRGSEPDEPGGDSVPFSASWTIFISVTSPILAGCLNFRHKTTNFRGGMRVTHCRVEKARKKQNRLCHKEGLAIQASQVLTELAYGYSVLQSVYCTQAMAWGWSLAVSSRHLEDPRVKMHGTFDRDPPTSSALVAVITDYWGDQNCEATSMIGCISNWSLIKFWTRYRGGSLAKVNRYAGDRKARTLIGVPLIDSLLLRQPFRFD